MADNKNMAINDEEMQHAAGGNFIDAPTPIFKVGDRVIVKGRENDESVIKEVHFTGDIVNHSYKYLVHIVSHSTGLITDAYVFEVNLSPA